MYKQYRYLFGSSGAAAMYTGGTQVRGRVGRRSPQPKNHINCHTLILRSRSFCIIYGPKPTRHAINHIIYTLPRRCLALLRGLYYSLIVGALLSGPLFCTPLQHSPHILSRIQIWRVGGPRHFPDTELCSLFICRQSDVQSSPPP